ncbi:MAG: NAD(P)-dependent oxidoreductase [Phycisphaerae bacterium]|nr:NAD(P)-dependent oxidoreductase [Phycisphaerae bacterium]
MKILVTGGSGFIGTRLVGELLERGHEVTIFDKKSSSQYPDIVTIGDIRDISALSKAAVGNNVIYHLAAEHTDNVRPISLYNDVNVGGAGNVAAAAHANGIEKIIFTSSVAVYPLNLLASEETPPAPFNEYGRSKYMAEKIFHKWGIEDKHRTLIIVRPAAIFGEANRGNVYNLLRQIYENKFVMIGSGRNKKSIGYVGNIVPFLIFCLNLPSGAHLFNYADKPDLTTNELIEITNEALGRNTSPKLCFPYYPALFAAYLLDIAAYILNRKFSISAVRIKKFCAETSVSADRLKMAGFEAPYTLKEALRQTINSEFSCADEAPILMK